MWEQTFYTDPEQTGRRDYSPDLQPRAKGEKPQKQESRAEWKEIWQVCGMNMLPQIPESFC